MILMCTVRSIGEASRKEEQVGDGGRPLGRGFQARCPDSYPSTMAQRQVRNVI